MTHFKISALLSFLPAGLLLMATPARAAEEGVATERADGKEIPIACTLTSAEERERKKGAEAQLFSELARVTELEDGYTLWFPRSEGQLARIARFVELESQCCAFVDFEIRIDAGGEEIAVDLKGPEGTKEVLRPLAELGSPTE